MIRKEAIQLILNKIGKNPIVSANGFISRDLFDISDKESNFYMIGSMSLASSIGLGLSLKNPNTKVFIFDGDGNLLMNLGSLVTIGALKPKNLVHVVFDNSSHESTGGQPTHSNKIALDQIAKAANYTVFKTNSPIELNRILLKIKKVSGPVMILVKIKKSGTVSKRISHSPPLIKKRFMNYLKTRKK